MTTSAPIYDAVTMMKCWDTINAMLLDQGIIAPAIQRWWRTRNGALDDINLGPVTPLDALLDGRSREVFAQAEHYCHEMGRLQKAAKDGL